MPAEREPDRLASPRVRARPILLAAAGCLAVIGVGMAGLRWLYVTQAHGGPHPQARPFPAPELETSLAPRQFRAPGVRAVQIPTAKVVGAIRYREAPPSDEAALAAAMQAVAAKGAQAYDPVAPVAGANRDASR